MGVRGVSAREVQQYIKALNGEIEISNTYLLIYDVWQYYHTSGLLMLTFNVAQALVTRQSD